MKKSMQGNTVYILLYNYDKIHKTRLLAKL